MAKVNIVSVMCLLPLSIALSNDQMECVSALMLFSFVLILAAAV